MENVGDAFSFSKVIAANDVNDEEWVENVGDAFSFSKVMAADDVNDDWQEPNSRLLQL